MPYIIRPALICLGSLVFAICISYLVPFPYSFISILIAVTFVVLYVRKKMLELVYLGVSLVRDLLSKRTR
jgi:hypothetical protein